MKDFFGRKKSKGRIAFEKGVICNPSWRKSARRHYFPSFSKFVAKIKK